MTFLYSAVNGITKNTGEVFEATICHSKQQRNNPPAFPGSFLLILIKKHPLFCPCHPSDFVL